MDADDIEDMDVVDVAAVVRTHGAATYRALAAVASKQVEDGPPGALLAVYVASQMVAYNLLRQIKALGTAEMVPDADDARMLAKLVADELRKPSA